LLAVLTREFPARGHLLEIASGPGQHAVFFAAAFPDLVWQPSDPREEARASIATYAGDAGLSNLRGPLNLDVEAWPWPIETADAMLTVNLLHVAPWSATEALFSGAAKVLKHGGPLLVYGPFKRDGQHTSAGNAAFDADLKARDPRLGLRDLDDVAAVARSAGFAQMKIADMPANNLTLVFRK
jgi:SAM-dependent methyltransferase